MSIDVHRRVRSNVTSPGGRPVTRVVLGSLAAGLAAAALLTTWWSSRAPPKA